MGREEGMKDSLPVYMERGADIYLAVYTHSFPEK